MVEVSYRNVDVFFQMCRRYVFESEHLRVRRKSPPRAYLLILMRKLVSGGLLLILVLLLVVRIKAMNFMFASCRLLINYHVLNINAQNIIFITSSSCVKPFLERLIPLPEYLKNHFK